MTPLSVWDCLFHRPRCWLSQPAKATTITFITVNGGV